jgi:hypothetical protein
VVQAPSRQQNKQHKSRQVGNAVPMHGKRADGQGHGVELGVNQHWGYCAAGKDGAELFLKEPSINQKTTIN